MRRKRRCIAFAPKAGQQMKRLLIFIGIVLGGRHSVTILSPKRRKAESRLKRILDSKVEPSKSLAASVPHTSIIHRFIIVSISLHSGHKARPVLPISVRIMPSST
jgi:hypothetical protein